MRRKTFWFDGQSAAAHGLAASGSGTFNAAERDAETVAVEGRSGDLIIDKGRYKNIPVEYPVSICSDVAANAERCRAWLGSRVGYCRLEDDWDPDHFRMGRFQGPLEFSPGFLNRTAEGVVRFDCKPQRFLKSGEIPFPAVSNSVIHNPTGFPAVPLLMATGIGAGVLTVTFGGVETDIIFQFGDSLCSIFLDCESLESWSVTEAGGRVSRNADVYGPDLTPVLAPEGSVFTWLPGDESNGLKSLMITPRWWTL